ncbi:MAG: PspC domain-containing protein, partial [Bacteroidota bacterium]|nr:PspC domain-containing protein [Bacteroidota bacterium]
MKKITRGNGRIGGVCEGLGDYFEVDPVLFRLLFIVAIFTPLVPAIL